MRIAILGAGMAGLALAFELLQDPHCSVTLFDPLGIGKGASGASTGLLHPFPGRLALSSWDSAAGMQATTFLLEEAARALGRPVADKSGLLRLAVKKTQEIDFLQCARKDPRASFWTTDQVQAFLPRATPAPALFIQEARAVYSRLYLEGLWIACQHRGAQLIQTKISSLQELDTYDRMILTLGAGITEFPLPHSIALKQVKGHALLCRIQEPIPCNIASDGHISKTEDPELVQIGSTYEHTFLSEEPDATKIVELQEKAALFYPPARHFIPLELKAGIRMAPHTGYRPCILSLNAKTWVFTGLGSRGLLYHASLSKRLAQKIRQPTIASDA